MTDEVAHVRARVGGQVEQLVRGHARPRVAGHVPHRVPAALAAGEPRLAELPDQLLGLEQRDVVHLDVLARRDVPLAQRHVLLDHLGERLHLLRRDAAEGELHADHLHVRLALAVDALLEAELDELVFLELPAEELRRLRLEVVVLALRGSGSRARARSAAPRGHRAFLVRRVWMLAPSDEPPGPGLAPGLSTIRRRRGFQELYCAKA